MAAETRKTAGGMLLAAAGSWPTLACALADLRATPYERALADAWCGAASHAAARGHCPACWTGAAALAAAAAFVAAWKPSRRRLLA